MPLNLNPAPVNAPLPPVEDYMEKGAAYSLYLKDSDDKPAPAMYGNLIASATSKVIIWDPYVHGDDMSVFSNLSHNVDISILMLCSAQNWGTRNADIINKLKQYIAPEFKASTSLRLAFIDKDRHGAGLNGSWQFHDRFLIIDDEIFLIGASMAHHRSPQQTTGIMRIEHEEDKIMIHDAFNQTYNTAAEEHCKSFFSNLL